MTAAPEFTPDLPERAPGPVAIPKGPYDESGTEWTVFWGGPHPDDCSGMLITGNAATALDEARFRPGAGVAERTVLRGAYRVLLDPEAGWFPRPTATEERP